MFVAMLTKEEKMAYDVYLKLRKYTPNANIETLRQISVYIARSNFCENVGNDIKFRYNENRDSSVIILNNGIEIEFNDISDEFGFIISKNGNKFSMRTVVSLSNPSDPSTVNVYSELIVKGYGMYVVTFRPKNLGDENSLKFATINYYTRDEIDWIREIVEEDIDNNFDIVAKRNGIYPFAEKSEFDLSLQTDIVLDGYQGYIYNVLNRIDLLYDNMKYIRVKRKKKVRK